MSVGLLCDSCRNDAGDFHIPDKSVDPSTGFFITVNVERKTKSGERASVDLCRRCYSEMLYRLLSNAVPDGIKINLDWIEAPT